MQILRGEIISLSNAMSELFSQPKTIEINVELEDIFEKVTTLYSKIDIVNRVKNTVNKIRNLLGKIIKLPIMLDATKLRSMIKSLAGKVRLKILLEEKIRSRLTALKNKLSAFARKRFAPMLRLKDRISDKIVKIKNSINAFVKRKIELILRVKNQVTVKLKSVKNKLNAFVRRRFAPIINLKDRVSDKIAKVKNNINAFVKRKFEPIIKFKNQVTAKLEKIKNKLVTFAKKKFEPILKLKEKVTQKLAKIKEKLKDLKNAAAPGIQLAVKTIGNVLQAGSELEQQKVNMQHFIGVNNTGKSDVEINKMSNDYMGWLRESANAASFDKNDVIGAGTQAVTATGGNVKEATEMVKLAQDMAALNPGEAFAWLHSNM